MVLSRIIIDNGVVFCSGTSSQSRSILALRLRLFSVLRSRRLENRGEQRKCRRKNGGPRSSTWSGQFTIPSTAAPSSTVCGFNTGRRWLPKQSIRPLARGSGRGRIVRAAGPILRADPRGGGGERG